MRYRLIPTRGQQPTQHLETDDSEWLNAYANAMATGAGVPVLVCEAPAGGIVRQLSVVGEDLNEKKGRAR